ncbi:MAG: hypothetical protein KA184_13180 [Candidatus Hydrogenedentes bacterium]|nr:hypothetical protein [Candidatus Hydrogenedentota bacterium]
MFFEEETKGLGAASVVFFGWLLSAMFAILSTLALPVAFLIALFTSDPQIEW